MKYYIRLQFWVLILMPLLRSYAQDNHDFDADSVLYTPIPKPNQDLTPNKNGERVPVADGKKMGYFFSLKTGPLINCKGCSSLGQVTFSTSVLNGITLGRKFRVAAGLGYDTYRDWQMLPLFGNVSWDIFGSKNSNALYAGFSMGHSMGWYNKNLEGYGIKNAWGGMLYHPEIGYRLRYHDSRLGISVGWKVQQMFTYFEYPSYYLYYGIWTEGEPNKTTIKEISRRLGVSLCIGWN